MLPPNCINKCSISIFNVNINKRAGQAEKTVDFKDQQSTWEYRMNTQPDPTFGNADTSDVPSDFFERPVKVAEFSWEIGSSLFQTFNPWALYFEEPRVANKMAHFRNLRCRLRLKFVLNGNPFYFGRAIASAQPLPHLDNITKFVDGVRQDFIQASQRPHVYLNPTTCEGGELVLPFFFYKNTLDIARAEWRDMGAVTLASMNPLRHANNAPEPVTITVFAMAEDVNVSTPTSQLFPEILPQAEEVPVEPNSSLRLCSRCLRVIITALFCDSTCDSAPPQMMVPNDEDSFVQWVHEAQQRDNDGIQVSTAPAPSPDTVISMCLEPQSGEEPQKDEYGMISAPAHQIANLAGDLSNAPVIGPYARATQVIASGIGSMAQLFGFSRPRVVEEPCSYLPRHAGHLAVTNVPDNIGSLAIDAKKEVTIDGRVVGLDGMDEMALVPIACRESYLTTFNWSTTDNPNDPLYSQRITPLMFDTNGTDIHLLPCAWTQVPFQYWKGSVELRFKIVCSEYHRGRMRIVWDPLHYSGGYSEIYNVAYTEVIDISETRDFSVRIGWGQQYSYLPCGSVRDMTDLILQRDFYDSTNYTCNGALSVMVVNQLTTPASTDPIEINVYAKMCEDYEVAVPDCSNLIDLELMDVPADFAGSGPIGGPGPPPEPPVDPYLETMPLTAGWFTDIDSALLRIDGTSHISDTFDAAGFKTFADPHPTHPIVPWSFAVTMPSDVTGSREVTVKFDCVFYTPPYNVGTAVNLECYTEDGLTLLGTLNTTIGTIRDGTNASLTFNVNFDGKQGKFLVKDADEGAGINHEQAKILVIELDFPWPETWTVSEFLASDTSDWACYKSGIRQPELVDSGGRPYFLAETPFTIRRQPLGTFALASDHMEIIMDLDNPAEDSNTFTTEGSSLFLRNPTSPLGRDIIRYGVRKDISVPGVIGDGDEVRVYCDSAPTMSVRVYGFKCIETVLAPESGEEMIQEDQGGEANAPLKANTEMYMAPTCDSGQINSVHFGERVTSWRQMLKRYNDVLRLSSTGNTNIVLNDSEIDDPAFAGFYPGFTVNPEMPLLRWVRSGYLARRGSLRYKVLVNAQNGLLKTATMSRVCLIEKAVGVLDSVADGDMPRVSHSGTTFANISETGVIDAEVPFYTNLRFQPARVFQDYAENYDRGREFTWFQVNVFSETNNSVDILQAASEDFSLHFFLSAPIVNLKV